MDLDEMEKRYVGEGPGYTEIVLMIEELRAARELEDVNFRLRECLEWYADKTHWTIDWVEGSHGDYGSRAREALKELEKVK